MTVLRPSQRRELIWSALMQIFCGRLRADQPAFRHWDKLSQSTREGLKQLTSDDIKNDYSSTWVAADVQTSTTKESS